MNILILIWYVVVNVALTFEIRQWSWSHTGNRLIFKVWQLCKSWFYFPSVYLWYQVVYVSKRVILFSGAYFSLKYVSGLHGTPLQNRLSTMVYYLLHFISICHETVKVWEQTLSRKWYIRFSFFFQKIKFSFLPVLPQNIASKSVFTFFQEDL